MQSPQEMLAELEDKFILGEVLESDYRDLKRQLIQQLRDLGETVQTDGQIQVAETVDSRNVPFCHIPAGGFFFGPYDEWKELKCPFYISKYPITVGEFREFLQNTDMGYTDEDWHTFSLVSPDDDCPASHLSYNDAKEFCRWLRRETGEYYSLPHELEWEKAARGEDGRLYPWGNGAVTSDYACYQGAMRFSCTVPVLTFEGANRSPYGCVDMVGNVWEWCLDSFDDPRDPHILRGGSWCNDEEYTNCLARTFSYPASKRVDYGGFRIIYLPGDLLTEYRRTYADLGKATKVGLKVVGLKKEKKDEPKKALKELSQALDHAAARAAAEDADTEIVEPEAEPQAEPRAEPQIIEEVSAETGDESINDAMAQAISEAAGMFLRKSDTESKMPMNPSGLSTISNIKKATGELPDGVGGPKYKSIEELRQEREEAKQDTEKKTLEFDEDENLDFERATPIEVSAGMTYTTIAIWFILLLAVLGAFAYKLNA